MLQEVTWWLFEAWVLLPFPVLLIALLSLPLPRTARRRVLSLVEKVSVAGYPCGGGLGSTAGSGASLGSFLPASCVTPAPNSQVLSVEVRGPVRGAHFALLLTGGSLLVAAPLMMASESEVSEELHFRRGA